MPMTLTLQPKWIEMAQEFGDLDTVVEDALRAYFLTQSQARMNEAERQISAYRQKYQCDYDSFQSLVQTDAQFLMQVEASHPLWEADAMEWQYWLEEQAEWRRRLAAIS